MSTYSNWKVKMYRLMEAMVSATKTSGLSKEFLIAYMDKTYGVSEKMTKKYIQLMTDQNYWNIINDKIFEIKNTDGVTDDNGIY